MLFELVEAELWSDWQDNEVIVLSQLYSKSFAAGILEISPNHVEFRTESKIEFYAALVHSRNLPLSDDVSIDYSPYFSLIEGCFQIICRSFLDKIAARFTCPQCPQFHNFVLNNLQNCKICDFSLFVAVPTFSIPAVQFYSLSKLEHQIFPRQSTAIEYLNEGSRNTSYKLLCFESSYSGLRKFAVVHWKSHIESSVESPARIYFPHIYFTKCLPNSRHWYEIIAEGFPCRLYFDIEFEVNEADESFNVTAKGEAIVKYLKATMSSHLCAFVRLLKPTLSSINVEFLVLNSSTDSKFSVHVISHCYADDQEILFNDNISCGLFVSSVLLSLYSITYDEIGLGGEIDQTNKPAILFHINSDRTCYNLVIDTSVYTKNRMFRMFGSRKFGKNKRELIISHDNTFHIHRDKSTSIKSKDISKLKELLLEESMVVPIGTRQCSCVPYLQNNPFAAINECSCQSKPQLLIYMSREAIFPVNRIRSMAVYMSGSPWLERTRQIERYIESRLPHDESVTCLSPLYHQYKAIRHFVKDSRHVASCSIDCNVIENKLTDAVSSCTDNELHVLSHLLSLCKYQFQQFDDGSLDLVENGKSAKRQRIENQSTEEYGKMNFDDVDDAIDLISVHRIAILFCILRYSAEIVAKALDSLVNGSCSVSCPACKILLCVMMCDESDENKIAVFSKFKQIYESCFNTTSPEGMLEWALSKPCLDPCSDLPLEHRGQSNQTNSDDSVLFSASGSVPSPVQIIDTMIKICILSLNGVSCSFASSDQIEQDQSFLKSWALRVRYTINGTSATIHSARITYQVANYRYCDLVERKHKNNHVNYIVDLLRANFWQSCLDDDCKSCGRLPFVRQLDYAHRLVECDGSLEDVLNYIYSQLLECCIASTN